MNDDAEPLHTLVYLYNDLCLSSTSLDIDIR